MQIKQDPMDTHHKLEYYTRLVYRTILDTMDPVTGLFASTLTNMTDHAWVRDNVYAVHAIWGLSLAYHKRTELDEDRRKAYELDQICVKVMRSLLLCMMRQSNKVEQFKQSQSTKDALHAKYSARNWSTVVGDHDWGHLQMDATSLYLLTLAQLTASGLQIVYTLDEVAFIQNLVFYIENAYCIADYGVWERGDKTNHGLPELNASSIGMAKAALQALNDLDLFGARGSQTSVIHVLPDEMQQCQAVLQSMLPRESYSKEIDASLLSIIGYPAFSVEDADLIQMTRSSIEEKLKGNYGFKRFLRDGYKTAREDPNRLYYEPAELQKFEHLECEWPIFFCYMILDSLYTGDTPRLTEYRKLLSDVIIETDDGLKLVPELFMVPLDKVDMELKEPHSQKRVPAGSTPFLWAQSLYILGCLLENQLIQCAEIDPLNRRLCTEKRPDIVVQVVVLAEDRETKKILSDHGLHVDTVEDVSPFVVQPASTLGKIYSQLGKNSKLQLSGRPSREVGLLSTSKLYVIDDRIFAFTPKYLPFLDQEFIDWQRFYLTYDTNILVDTTKSELFYVKSSWNVPGRPLVVISLSKAMITGKHLTAPLDPHDVTAVAPSRKQGASWGNPSGMIATLKKMKSGYLSGTRIIVGRIQDFVTTSCITKLNFLTSDEQGLDKDFKIFLDSLLNPTETPRARLPSGGGVGGLFARRMSVDHRSKMSVVRGYANQRRKSVFVEANSEDALRRLRAKYASALTSSNASPYASQTSIYTTSPTIPSSPGVLDEMFKPDYVGHRAPGFGYATFEAGTSVDEEGEATPTRASPPGSDKDSSSDHRDSLTAATLRLAAELALEPRHDLGLEGVDCGELVEMLYETDSLEEQADILHYLWLQKGPNWDTQLGGKIGTPVRGLVEELYQKACNAQIWWLVRHSAGLLGKKVDDAAKAVTDLLVRQKQITVGMPAFREGTIAFPLSAFELQKLVKTAFGDDDTSVVLTLEILVYLGMFVRTEPRLFSEMIRLRVGLILQVMTSELARALHCPVIGEEASNQLLNLTPYEMKTLLHHVLSGREFGEVDQESHEVITHTERTKAERTGALQLRKALTKHKISMASQDGFQLPSTSPAQEDDRKSTTSAGGDSQTSTFGQWLRRRRIDGALNRVPADFYPKIWAILRRIEVLSIEGHVLHQNLTKEMTSNEIKFALCVEAVLNRIAEPEYRQLMVEALMVLTLLASNPTIAEHNELNIPNCIYVEYIVHEANRIFLDDQKRLKGDATACCAHDPPQPCVAIADICNFFYDSPPSGCYGTITYMCRAMAHLLSPGRTDDCAIS